MSRYQLGYDSSEARRSPRDQSTARYNDPPDDFRGGANRERRRSFSDTRATHNIFSTNRELFRESTSRDSSRDFPSRDPPRGPKGVPDAPTGPRASSYGDFRCEVSIRGDVRGERGRGIGRGWREESRERGREIDRDYRDRRDGRAPISFREERGRDRWAGREVYVGNRRPSSPQGRGRSPSYAQREIREPPPSLDIDRTRRGSRDGPLSAGPVPSDSAQPFTRGYGRGRGVRGRVRGSYYDELHRTSGQSRSPIDNSWNHRNQPSATPPPQVPAFGSATNSISSGPNPPTSSAVNTHGPVPGIAVPTAPRSERRSGKSTVAGTAQNFSENSRREIIDQNSCHSMSPTNIPLRTSSPISKFEQKLENIDNEKREEGEVFKSPKLNHNSIQRPEKISPCVTKITSSRATITDCRRYPVIGIRPANLHSHAIEDEANSSNSDSGDDFGDEYFEKEIARVQAEIETFTNANPFLPSIEPEDCLLKILMESDILDVIEATKFANPNDCQVSKNNKRPRPLLSAMASPKTNHESTTPKGPTISHIPSPLNLMSAKPQKPQISVRTLGPELLSWSSDTHKETKEDFIERSKNKSRTETTSQNSQGLKRAAPVGMIEDEKGSETKDCDNLPALEAVRKRMKTPPISSLPSFTCKPWHQDKEFSKTLEPNSLVEAQIVRHLTETSTRRRREQDEERRLWAVRYHRYRRFTDYSNDPAAVRSREKFLKSRAKSAAEAATRPSVMASSASKPEGSRRVGSRFASEHELQRVLLESEQEAKESKERDDCVSRASNATAREAIIPDMIWDKEERYENDFEDRTGLISFERSFAILEFGEPIDNFTANEAALFEKAYFEFPKQWGKIAECLPNRDYKSCIQHYYLVKHPSNLKKKLKDHSKKKKGRQSRSKKDKNVALIHDLGSTREEDEMQDAETDSRSRRPRRAAAPTFNSDVKDQASENEVASPAPVASRKVLTPKIEPTFEALQTQPPTPVNSTTKRKAKAPREKAAKQAKGNQPAVAATGGRIVDDSPATPSSTLDGASRREPIKNLQPEIQYNKSDTSSSLNITYTSNEFISKSTGSNSSSTKVEHYHTPQTTQLSQAPYNSPSQPESQPQPCSPQTSQTTPPSSHQPVFQQKLQSTFQANSQSMLDINCQPSQQSASTQDNPGLLSVSSIDQPSTQKTVQQTSSYWSVPEQDVFSALLGHFGTNWHGIAKHMTTKTHIMVKNYYQRQVDNGKMKEWEIIAKTADEKKERGEPTGPLPAPVVIPPKRRTDIPGTSIHKSGSSTENNEELSPVPPNSSSQASPQPAIFTTPRFPTIAQASPILQTPSAATTAIISRHLPPQPIQQTPPQTLPTTRGRGPPLGYFETTSPSRQQLQSDQVSQRTLKAAHDAQMERQLALRLEQEQHEQQKQQLHREQQQIQAQRAREHQAQQQENLRRERENELEHERQIQVMQKEAQKITLHREKTSQQREQNFVLQPERQAITRKEEKRSPELKQYDAYIPQSMLNASSFPSRNEGLQTIPVAETRRPTQQPFQSHQSHLQHSTHNSFLSESSGAHREFRSNSSQIAQQNPVNAAQRVQEVYSAPQTSVSLATRQPETVRKTSSIMSLLNEEPCEARSTPSSRANDMSSSKKPQQNSPSPYSHSVAPCFSTKNSQINSQTVTSILPQTPSQTMSHLHPHPNPHSQPKIQHTNQSPHPMQSHPAPIGNQTRSFTPTPGKFESRGYAASIQTQPQSMFTHSSQQQTQQQATLKSSRQQSQQVQLQSQQQTQYQTQQQPQRQSINNQGSTPTRREASVNDIHIITNNYTRTPSVQPSGSRLKESPYSANSPSQSLRQAQAATSPVEITTPDRDYYGHQRQHQRTSHNSHQQFLPQQIQQANPASTISTSGSYSNSTTLHNRASYHSHSQQSHSHGQQAPQQPKPHQVGHRQISYGHTGHSSGSSNNVNSPSSQYPNQIQHASHNQNPLHTNHVSPNTSTRSRRSSFDGRFNTQIPSSNSQNSIQRQTSFSQSTQSVISSNYNTQQHGNTTGVCNSTQQTSPICEITENYYQYEREHDRRLRTDGYHQARLREQEGRSR